MSPESQPVLVRKVGSASRLAGQLVSRSWSRGRNVARKQWRHYAKRTVWSTKRARERMKNARVTSVNLLRLSIDRVLNLRKPFIRLSRRSRRSYQLVSIRREEWRVERDVRRLGASGRPIILGPWISEVGFEALYWIPFLRWLKGECGWNPANVVAVSRGGVASWYGDLADRYVEIFDHITPSEFARRNESRRETGDGSHKQLQLSDLDAELIAMAAREHGLQDPAVIHPSYMYRLFRHFWLGHRPISHVQERTRFTRPAPPTRFDLGWLPRDYVALKAYTAQSLPESPAHRSLLRALVDHLARTTNVVVLETGFSVDDHSDFQIERADRVFQLDRVMTPQNNLELQTQVIAGAKTFIGTCGSLTWLAPMLGVPTVALFADARFLRTHLYLARHAYGAMGAADFATVDVTMLGRLGIRTDSILARVASM